MYLYVVRHGETAENTRSIMQGNMDTVLDEKGKLQAKEAKEKLKGVQIDLIISSPKQRTLETALIVADDDTIIITDDRLLSRDHGEFQGKSRYEINLKDYWNIKLNKQYERAECVQHIYDRVDSLINEIKTKYKNKTVLLVTHSGICRILYYYFNGIPEDGDLMEYESTNCSVERYELED